MEKYSIQIIEDFIPAGRGNRPGLKISGPEWITIHDTGNPRPGADALAHARYLKGNAAAGIPVSWHYTVDGERIVQHLPLEEVGWHAGDGPRGKGNRSSIGIEICENEDGDRRKAEENAAWLAAHLLQKFGLGADRVVQHHKWNGKNCPHLLRKRPDGWRRFLAAVEENLNPGIFPDVSFRHWAAEGIAFVKEHNLMRGKDDGKFYPEEPLTRAELAVVLKRFYHFLESSRRADKRK